MAIEQHTEVLPALSTGAHDNLPAAPARMSGARKAAVLLAALGSERSAGLIQLLGEEEIESLSREMARLSSVGAETTRSIFTELTTGGSGAGADVQGGLELAQEMIERALGAERAAEILGRLSGGESRPFEFLRRIPPEQIAKLMRGESAQTIALVLASLHANLAAGVLSRLPAAEQPEVALRIARMGEASTEVIHKVEAAIRGKLGEEAEEEYATTGGAKALAGILNHADRSLERNVLENLAGSDQELAEEVRGMLFVFEDIAKLEERAVQQVLREVDQKDLVLALRGAEEAVMEIVLTNMSERGAEMLKEEMEIQPPQRKRDVEAAQSRVVAVIRRLEEAGTIVIGGGGEGDGEEAEDVV
jgi:flagellar motor switch protein FliG